MFNKIYKGRKVLVTGHTGFKGSWLSLWLIHLGAEVVGYSLAPPTKPNLFEALNLKNKLRHIFGDVRDLTHLKKVMGKYQPEVIFHLAAQPIVKKSYQEPKETFETNVLGTVNVLEAARLTNKVRVVVNITSDKCYENKEWLYGYRENDMVGGHDPYSASKACSELVTTSYRQSFFGHIGLATVRAGNVIGGGDWGEDRLLPDCIKALINRRTVILRNPESVRPWQYILEPLSGYFWLGALLMKDASKYSEAWNFGPKDENFIKAEQMARKIINIWGKGSVKFKKEKYHETNLLKLDISKAAANLYWRPIYGIDKTIEKTINWYKEYYLRDKKNMFKFSLNQIEEYEQEAKINNLLWSKR